MIKSLRSKAVEKIKNLFSNLDTPAIKAINNSDWDELYKLFKDSNREGWAYDGAFWSTIYNLNDKLYEELDYIPEGAFAYTDIEKINLENISTILECAFYQSYIKEITLSNKLKYIGVRSLNTDANPIIHIRFKGTMKEFKKIKKGTEWYKRVAYVVCDDGDLEYGG